MHCSAEHWTIFSCFFAIYAFYIVSMYFLFLIQLLLLNQINHYHCQYKHEFDHQEITAGNRCDNVLNTGRTQQSCCEHFRTLRNLQLALRCLSQAGRSKPNEHATKLWQASQRLGLGQSQFQDQSVATICDSCIFARWRYRAELERPACDKQRRTSCKLRKVLKCTSHCDYNGYAMVKKQKTKLECASSCRPSVSCLGSGIQHSTYLNRLSLQRQG